MAIINYYKSNLSYPKKILLKLTESPDLGKVLTLPQFGGLPQWAVVGKSNL